ncbi:MAG TPA: YbaB/EbfC family nucleoid-associated protein [Phytomonospora sp.]
MTDPRRADDGRQIQAQAARLRELIEGARAESVSDDYAVRVAVGPGDTVLDVEVTTRALGRSGNEIGALIVAELKKASRELGEELNGKMAEILSAQQVNEAISASSLPTVDEVRREREALHRQRVEEQREHDR